MFICRISLKENLALLCRAAEMRMRRIPARPDRCPGCSSCELACSAAHGIAPASGGDGASPRLRAVTISSSLMARDGTRPTMIYPVRCHQCEDPACMMACLSGAITQREDGLMVIEKKHCVGCRLSTGACPYGAIVVDESRAVAVKCDPCDGRASLACVDACLVGALVLIGGEEGR